MQFFDARAGYLELREEIDAAIARVLESGSYIRGPEVEAFEAEWAAYCGVKHCVGVGNGFDALRLIVEAMDLAHAGVLMSQHGYVVTWLAVSAAGAYPRPWEWGRLGCEAALAIHLYGRRDDAEWPADLTLIEDCAQAHGLKPRGTAAAFSFYPTKNLGAFGDGGAVVTNNGELAARIRRLANYGERSKNDCAERGINSRLDELQAAVLRMKLPHLDAWNARRAAIAGRYNELLAGLPIELPDPGETVWHQYVIRTGARDWLRLRLERRGIPTMVHYPRPPHLHDCYKSLCVSLPETECRAEVILSLPIYPQMPMEDVERVCHEIRLALQ